ncbi:MAG: (d)CMP kinase [Eubacteriales bacterium]|nr:(d)CMP kinase [Eubacteriales bacterium]
MKNQTIHIAIDGPAGAGKSTVARAVAAHFGIAYLDTGAMYRAVGLKALRAGVDVQDEAAVCALLPQTQLNVVIADGGQQVLLNGENVSQAIRTPEAAQAASAVSRYGRVREWLVEKQRAIAAGSSVVMDGRDIGTNVLPRADHKFFLTADARVRAQRRALEMEQRGEPVDLDELTRQIRERDRQDSTRAINPLCRADDAVEVDTTAMTQQQVIDHMIGIIQERQR